MEENMVERSKRASGEILLFVERQKMVFSLLVEEGDSMVFHGNFISASERPEQLDEVELEVDADVLAKIARESDLNKQAGASHAFTAVLHGHPEIEVWAVQPDRDEKLWNGRLVVRGASVREAIRFLYRAYHSPGVEVVIVCIWGFLCALGTLSSLKEKCQEKAQATCGKGKVKKVSRRMKWRLTGCGIECKIECK
jgi:hypothetical protein